MADAHIHGTVMAAGAAEVEMQFYGNRHFRRKSWVQIPPGNYRSGADLPCRNLDGKRIP